MASSISRRDLLARGLRVSLAGVVAGVAVSAGAADKICADMQHLPSDQVGLRTSLNYVELSPDQTKVCAGCGLFQSTEDGCGTCMIFNGPANAKGHCDSWSPKS